MEWFCQNRRKLKIFSATELIFVLKKNTFSWKATLKANIVVSVVKKSLSTVLDSFYCKIHFRFDDITLWKTGFKFVFLLKKFFNCQPNIVYLEDFFKLIKTHFLFYWFQQTKNPQMSTNSLIWNDSLFGLIEGYFFGDPFLTCFGFFLWKKNFFQLKCFVVVLCAFFFPPHLLFWRRQTQYEKGIIKTILDLFWNSCFLFYFGQTNCDLFVDKVGPMGNEICFFLSLSFC